MVAWSLGILLSILPLPTWARDCRRFWRSQFPTTQPDRPWGKILLAALIGSHAAVIVSFVLSIWFSQYEPTTRFLVIPAAIDVSLAALSRMAAPDLYYELCAFRYGKPIPQGERKPVGWYWLLIVCVVWMVAINVYIDPAERAHYIHNHSDFFKPMMLIAAALAWNFRWYSRNAGKFFRFLLQAFVIS